MSTDRCVACGTILRYQSPFDLCYACQKEKLLCSEGPVPHECDDPHFDSKNDFCMQCTENEYPQEEPRLKLFKVSIPSQTIPWRPPTGTHLDMIGDITDYGFIQGREIIVLASDGDRLFNQCMRELGCSTDEIEMHVVEIEGPFKHGYVIAHHQPKG